MKVAIISDTHLKKNSGQLNALTDTLHKADLVVHAGDYGNIWVLKYLQDHFNFTGVWGLAHNA
ncbi:hypothetical protein P22_3450 [Propionispora sp. 2/2-37]|uniref:metallophosphoesterase family protein n=1 Tax=Propionispora sp. 2/2-37 TaxID=1677858 RepID=UPI0006BB5CFC|nr:metallophosphoesterase family protein [Propionispora sp. 2/2-37]CUH97323.1 hypothetical protein P22_3450 [Propionispora sp. 2/2-37]